MNLTNKQKRGLVMWIIIIISSFYLKPVMKWAVKFHPEVVESRFKLCRAISEPATEIMQMRQNNVSYDDARKEVSRYTKYKPVFFKFVNDAYKVYPYQSEKHQQKAIDDFESKAFTDCMDYKLNIK